MLARGKAQYQPATSTVALVMQRQQHVKFALKSCHLPPWCFKRWHFRIVCILRFSFQIFIRERASPHLICAWRLLFVCKASLLPSPAHMSCLDSRKRCNPGSSVAFLLCGRQILPKARGCRLIECGMSLKLPASDILWFVWTRWIVPWRLTRIGLQALIFSESSENKLPFHTCPKTPKKCRESDC